MASRREFLKTTGAAVAAAALPHSVRAQAGPIDWHAHWIGPHVVELLGSRTTPPLPQGAGWYDIDLRVRHLDQVGVQHQVLSWVGATFDSAMSPDEARPFWRAQNDDLAAAVRKYPGRFSALATLPTANPQWAADELERAHEELGLIGATLPLDAFVSLAGAKSLAPIFAAAQKHRSHIFVHRGAAAASVPGQRAEAGTANEYFGLPAGGASQRAAATPGDHLPARTTLMTATHLATGVITLALTDLLDPYPDVTIQIAMIGGAIPIVAEQIEIAAEEAHQPSPTRKLTRVYVDTGATGHGPLEIALAAKVFGADRILFGSDNGPQPSIAPVLASIEDAELTADQRNLILVENGRRLLGVKRT